MNQSSIPAYRADYTCVIWHPEAFKILMLESSLPVLTSPESVYSSPYRVHDQILEQLNLEVRVLRRIGFERDVAANHAWMAFELEFVGDASNIPTGAKWLSKKEINQLPLESQRQLVTKLFTEARDVFALRPIWTQREWWDEILGSIDAWLKSQNATRTGFSQLKTWQISSLSRIETTVGRLYLKVVPPFFAREPGLTGFLASLFPKNMPEVLVVNFEIPWMLMRDFGDLELSETTPLDQVCAALNSYAKLQIESLKYIPELQSLGCQNRGLINLASDIQNLLGDETVLLRDEEDGFTSQQITTLRELEPEFLKRCEIIGKSGIPDMLEHGDLWLNNVNIRDGQAVFYDWTDGALTFPLLGMPLSEFENDIWDQDTRESLIEAYLEPFTQYQPMNLLKEMLFLVQPLVHLYRAVSYQRFIIPGVEDKTEWQSGCIWSFKSVLKIMNEA